MAFNLRLERIVLQPLQHFVKVNKDCKLLKLDVLPGTNLRGTSWRARNDFNIDRIDPRHETRLIHGTSRIRFSSLPDRFQSIVPAGDNCLAWPMHKTRRDGGRDAQEEMRIWHCNGPGLLSMSGRCRYVEAKVVLDVQTWMCGDAKIRNECVCNTFDTSAMPGIAIIA